MPRLSAKKKAEYLGASPKEIARDLRAFSRTGQFLSSNERRLLKKYPEQWVAIYNGKVRASAKSLDGVISKLEQLKLPPNESIIWYMDTSGRRVILRNDTLPLADQLLALS
jgi:Family of unknown function (DUF5678)